MIWLWWMLSVVYAHEVELHYSTDLPDMPQVIIEHNGMKVEPSIEAIAPVDDLQIWKILWESSDAWLHHIYISHSESDESVETVLVGRASSQQVYLLNDTQRPPQWTSAVGGREHVAAQELKHRQRPIWWLVGIGLLCFWFGRSRTPDKTSTHSSTIGIWQGLLRAWVERQSSVLLWLYGLLIFLVCSMWLQRSVFWSDGIPAMYHDALGSYWLIGRSSTWSGWFDPLTSFPIGQAYSALDSYILWGVSQLFAWIEPRTVYVAWVLVCPALSASAAEWLAREWGVRSPWSLLTGIVFGFSGLMCNALLEGQIYQTLLVGLPCTAIAVQRYQRQPTVWAWLGILFSVALCLFSSSYIGASCLLLLFGLWIGNQGWKKSSSWWVFVGVIPLLWVQYRLMSTGGGLEVRELLRVSIGSLSLETFWGSTPELDRERHAIALGLSTVGGILALSTVVWIRQPNQWKKWLPILCVGGLSLMFALGPTWQVSVGNGLEIPPMVWLFTQQGFSSIGFPIRLAQPFILCVGILGAFGLQQLVQRHTWSWVLLPLAFVQVGQQDLVNRQQFWSIDSPNLEELQGEAVFTLYPLIQERSQGSDADVVLYMQDCLAQVSHQKGIANDCISVQVQSSMAKSIQKSVLQSIAENKSVWSVLEAHQIDSLVFYPEWFREPDRIRLRTILLQDSTKVLSGNHPLQYEVYQRQEGLIQTSVETESSTIQLDVWTSKDHEIPLLLLGNGILAESKVSIFEQSVRHGFSLRDVSFGTSVLLQATEGSVIWEGSLYPNPKTDHIQIRQGEGLVMELPVLDSPPIVPDTDVLYWIQLFVVFGVLGLSMKRVVQPSTKSDG